MTTPTTHRLGKAMTPTGRLVVSIDAPRSEWLAARRHGITATDVTAIMGSPYRTAYDVWADKVMEPAEDKGIGEAGLWGQRLEDPVAQEWARRNNVKLRRVGLIQHVHEPFMMASLDRLVSGCTLSKSKRCALEVKTRSAYSADDWKEGVPEDVFWQVQWQMLVSGFTHIHVAALIGGQRLVEHTVFWDMNRAQHMIPAVHGVWQAVCDRTPPDLPQALWSDGFLDQRHPDRQGGVEIDNANFLCADYEDLSDHIRNLKAKQALLKTRLVGMLGDAEVGLFEGRPFYSYKPSTRRTLSTKLLEELYPEVASDDRIWNTTTSRTLRITNAKESK